MNANKHMRVGCFKHLHKILEKHNPRLQLSFTIRYHEELQLDDNAFMHLHEVEDIPRIFKSSESMDAEERRRAGIDDLLEANSHLPYPSPYNPVKTKDSLRELFRVVASLANPPALSVRGPLYAQFVYEDLKCQCVIMRLSLQDFVSVAEEVWGADKKGAKKENKWLLLTQPA